MTNGARSRLVRNAILGGILLLGSLFLYREGNAAGSSDVELAPITAALGQCAFCFCCDANCQQAWGESDPRGSYENQPCVTDFCVWRGGDSGEEGPCPEEHSEDPPLTASDVAQIWNTAISSDVRAIRQVLKEHSFHVKFNRDRQAIQVVKCNTVIANVPVAPEIAAQIADEQ